MRRPTRTIAIYLLGKLYEINGYRLLWSDGGKPTSAAISLLQQLRFAGERGLDPEDYPGNRLAYLLNDLLDTPHSGIEQWAENVELVAKGTSRLRQRPGPNNSLGLVKFMMPNTYNVYLHSTPVQSLFAETRRDFSHGCVRVSDPVGLAQYVLRDSPEWTREKILAAMNGSKPVTVTLKSRIRVFMVYGTALATEKGTILFFDDIYWHDERLQKALDARRARS